MSDLEQRRSRRECRPQEPGERRAAAQGHQRARARRAQGPHKVAHLSISTAQLLGLSAEEVERVELAGRLHDVGKLAIPEAILNKPGPLDAHEWVIMRTHAEIGERILAAAPSLAHVAGLVRSHHEHQDGSGYPDHLAARTSPSARGSWPSARRSSR